MKSSTLSIIAKSTTGLTPEEACDVRAHAWAFVFSRWRAKREDGPVTAPDDPKVSKAKEVDHVEPSHDESSDVKHHRFTKEEE